MWNRELEPRDILARTERGEHGGPPVCRGGQSSCILESANLSMDCWAALLDPHVVASTEDVAIGIHEASADRA